MIFYRERCFFASDGEVTDNRGEKLDAEKKLNINKNVTYDDIIGVAKAIGVEWEKRTENSKFIVAKLEFSEEYKKELNESFKTMISASSKPWWKFW